MNIPNELVDRIVQGECVVFVGAGLSQGAGLPDWPGLVRQMLDWSEESGVDLTDRAELEDLIANGELLLVAGEMRDRLRGELGNAAFGRFMERIFRRRGLKPTECHRLVARIPFAAALTSNYDTLLGAARTLVTGGESSPVFTYSDVPELATALYRGFYLLHVHGTIDRSDEIVLGGSDYREAMYDNPAYRHHLSTLFSTKTILFLGFGLTDPDILPLLDQMWSAFRGHIGTHYALMNTQDVPNIKQKWFKKDYGIQIIPYTPSAPDHPEVQEFLENLADKVEEVERRPTNLVDEVRIWLQVIGYEVENLRMHDDRTEEMSATFNRGPFSQEVLVRCISGEIKLTDVKALDAVLNRNRPQGWLISDRSVSGRVQAEAANIDNLQVLNLAEFLEEKVWKGYFEALRSLVEHNKIPDWYVDMACFKKEIREDADGEGDEIVRHQYDSLDDYIDEWQNAQGKTHIAVFGPFGAGKTWFCRHYAYRQLQRYLRNPMNERLPLLITLRQFTNATTARQLINDALIEQYKLPFVGSAFDSFRKMNRQGKLLLILDGFDEMARKVDDETRVNNFEELAKLVVDEDSLVVDEDSKVILTSRTEYFRDAGEVDGILSDKAPGRRSGVLSLPMFEILYLEDFSPGKIREMIVKRWGEENGSDIADVILRHPDLAGMARKPVVTELLLAALEELKESDEVSPEVPKNLAQVYLYATHRLLLRNIENGITFTKTADKLYFLCRLALKMITDGELRTHYRDFPEEIRTYFREQIGDQHTLDIWVADLQNQTLLHRDAAGYYDFAHKSLGEYFAALKMTAELGSLAPEVMETYFKADEQPCEMPFVQNIMSVEDFHADLFIDEDWKQRFIFMAGLMDRADDLLRHMQTESQKYINTRRLQDLLHWAEQITEGSTGDFKPAAKRVIAIKEACAQSSNLAIYEAWALHMDNPGPAFADELEAITDHAQSRANVRVSVGKLATRLDDRCDETLAIDKFFEATRLIVLRSALALIDVIRSPNSNDNDIDTAAGKFDRIRRNSRRRIIYSVDRGKPFRSMFNACFDNLDAKVTRHQKKDTIDERSFETLLKTWLDTLELTSEMINLSDEEWQALENYMKITHFLIDCKQAALRVSPSVWEEIEERILLIEPRHHQPGSPGL